MKNELEQLHARVFGMEFHQYTQVAFDKMVAAGEYAETEHDDGVARVHLRTALSREQDSVLTDLDKLQQEKRAYAAEYAFHCGVAAAFEQFFSKAERFTFSTALEEGLFMVTGMKRHPNYEALADQVRKGYDGLEQELEEADCEHLTSHECAWDERIHYAALSGYYYGYRAGLALLDRVCPLSTEQMMSKILMTEYELGITMPRHHREHEQKKKGA